MKIQLILLTEFGEFKGDVFEVDTEQYENILNLSKNYYESGFEMTLENGNWMILETGDGQVSGLSSNQDQFVFYSKFLNLLSQV